VTGLPWIVAAGVLAGASVIVMWPSGGSLWRLQQPAESPLRSLSGVRIRLRHLGDLPPRRLVVLTTAGAAATGLILGGPVAGVVAAVYGALGARAVIRRAQRKRAAASRAGSLDDLCALAADLRAGLPPAIAAPAADPVPTGPAATDPRLAELTAAVWRLGERTGAPAADLIERIEADARAGDRATATAAAEAAGAQATAMLLAALPLGGIALGYSIGADPLQVLLHTRLGAACAIGAVLLQCAGLLWCERLVAGPGR
jgi:tight adherence protein B